MTEFSSEELAKRIDLGVRRGVAKALKQRKEAGLSIYVSDDDGKIIKIEAKDIQVPVVE